MGKTLLTLGHGYCAKALCNLLHPKGWRVLGTYRTAESAASLTALGVEPVRWATEDVASAIGDASHILVSAGPDAVGDPSLRLAQDALVARAAHLEWLGYLSTTGVYGDHGGAWVDETTPLTPGTRRGLWRKSAEQAWQSIPTLPLHIFRLAGIYGPGRGPFSKVQTGNARRIIKPGQVFSRIHVDDIARVLAASIKQPDSGAIYNVCDDDPAPPQDVLSHAAHLLEVPEPPAIDFETADMTPMARSFYAENKRVSNARMKAAFGPLTYPSYREGLHALLNAK
ncbi:MAG: SDR family oxidoreductase [Pelagimonas sp.]|jgi:nucleoside-diphosphate-sugar epimerase|nr:SDR family oxidoreductase [Pelagimonas sp.]